MNSIEKITPGFQDDGTFIFQCGIDWNICYRIMYRIYRIECWLMKFEPVDINTWVFNWDMLHTTHNKESDDDNLRD